MAVEHPCAPQLPVGEASPEVVPHVIASVGLEEPESRRGSPGACVKRGHQLLATLERSVQAEEVRDAERDDCQAGGGRGYLDESADQSRRDDVAVADGQERDASLVDGRWKVGLRDELAAQPVEDEPVADDQHDHPAGHEHDHQQRGEAAEHLLAPARVAEVPGAPAPDLPRGPGEVTGQAHPGGCRTRHDHRLEHVPQDPCDEQDADTDEGEVRERPIHRRRSSHQRPLIASAARGPRPSARLAEASRARGPLPEADRAASRAGRRPAAPSSRGHRC